MKILETRVMRGPNQWSDTQRQLVVLKISTEDVADEDINRVHEKYRDTLSELGELSFSSNFPRSVQLIQFLACHLQSKSGMDCSYSRIKPTSFANTFFLIYSYVIEQAGVEAGHAAVELAGEMIQRKTLSLAASLEELVRLKSKYHIGPTSNYILEEIKRRRIPFRRFDYGSLVTVGYGNRQRKIRTAVTDSTSGLGIEMAGDKEETKNILAEHNCPVPRGILVRSEKELVERLNEVSFPLVIKPLDGNHGRGVTTHIDSLEKAKNAFDRARKISEQIIVEEFVEGEDYRFLVINYKMVAVAKRTPAYVIGNGHSTIEQLIDEENKHKDRGSSYEHVLAKIAVDGTTLKLVHQRGLELDSVLPLGEKLFVKETANISAGGTAEDVTDLVHPSNKFMVERIAKLFNLNICGVDIMTTSVEEPITRETGAIIEVNAGPGLRMHSNPQKGKPRDIAAPIIDMLYPDDASFRIPLVAVTGTNGKTTTTRLIAHLAGAAGKVPGFCTTDGIYIDGHLLYRGDCTGSVSAQSVLFDPSIDFAVLECARGGIIRSGLGFEESDIAVVTNITEDHLGLKDIHTLEELTQVKRVVTMTVKPDGYAVLNAADDRVFSLYQDLPCKKALFSVSASNERLQEHIRNGGIGAAVEKNQVTIYNGSKIIIEDIRNIPLSFEGRAEFMTGNILAAVLAAYLNDFEISAIKNGLLSFIPSPELTPGRMNLFDFEDFKMLIDYAHNSDGFKQLKKFMAKVPEKPKTGIISVAGDRRENDIVEVGKLVAEMFDIIIIRHNKESRGVGQEGVMNLLTKGIKKVKPHLEIIHISDEYEALEFAINHAKKGSFIFACADKVQITLEYVSELFENYKKLKKAI